MFEQNLLLILALLPFGGAIAAATLPANARNAEAWLSGLVMVAGLAMLAVLYPQVEDGGRVLSRIEWVPSLGLNLTFRIDGFSWLFMLLVQGIGFLVVLYARYYMSPKDPVPRFYAFLLAFTGSMSGILLSGNIIMLVVFMLRRANIFVQSVAALEKVCYYYGNFSWASSIALDCVKLNCCHLQHQANFFRSAE